MRLEGRTAIVTGGATGVGAGVARRFTQEGARVLIADLHADAGRAMAESLGPNALAHQTDVSDDASVARLAAVALRLLGRIDVLVNNAGIGQPSQPLEDLAPEAFERLLAVNVRSIYLTARHFVGPMKLAGGGAILNIASTAGDTPRPNLTWRHACNGWIIAATLSMAAELAPDNIRVNALKSVSPQSRPDDISSAALYLCSPDAAMVSGVAVDLDGAGAPHSFEDLTTQRT